MGGGRSFSDRCVFKCGKGGDFEGSGEEWGRGGEVGFGTECGDGNDSVGVVAGCGRCVRCGRIVGSVIEGDGYGVGGARGGIGVEVYSCTTFWCWDGRKGGGFPVFGE